MRAEGTHDQKAPLIVRGKGTHDQKAPRIVRGKGSHGQKAPRIVSDEKKCTANNYIISSSLPTTLLTKDR